MHLQPDLFFTFYSSFSNAFLCITTEISKKQRNCLPKKWTIFIFESKQRIQNTTLKPQAYFCNLKAHFNEVLSVIISTDSSATPLL